MTWTHIAIAGLTFDLIGAVVVSYAIFRVSVKGVYEQALSAPKADAATVNKRAKWLGEERAYARAGVALITIGIALQLIAAFGGISGRDEWVFAAIAVSGPSWWLRVS